MIKNKIMDTIISDLKDILSVQDDSNSDLLDNITESTHLIGPKSFIDSLTLVSLIVDIEQKINEEYDITVTIADERAMSQKKSPFRTVGTLAEYVEILVNEKK